MSNHLTNIGLETSDKISNLGYDAEVNIDSWNIFNFIDNISQLGLLKELIIVILFFSIIIVASWETIFPIFLEFKTTYSENLITIIPILILIIVIVISICSHFKIFGQNAIFEFNSKLTHSAEYKRVIKRKISQYRNKLFKIAELYNNNELKRNELKSSIQNFKTNNEILTKTTEDLLISCTDLNDKNKRFMKNMKATINQNIDSAANRARELFDRAKQIRSDKILVAKKRRAEESNKLELASQLEDQRQNRILQEKLRRENIIDKKRLELFTHAKTRKENHMKHHKYAHAVSKTPLSLYGRLKVNGLTHLQSMAKKQKAYVPFTPSDEQGICSNLNLCSGHAHGNYCKGENQPIGDGGCNKYCIQAGKGQYYRSDLKGCVNNCEPATEFSCYDPTYLQHCGHICNKVGLKYR